MNNLTNPYAWLHLLMIFIQGVIYGWTFTRCFRCKISTISISFLAGLLCALVVVPQVLFMISIELQPVISIFVHFGLGLLFVAKGTSGLKVFTFWFMRLFVDGIVQTPIMIPLVEYGFIKPEDGIFVFTATRLIGTIMFTIAIIPAHYIYAKIWNKIVNKLPMSINKTGLALIIFPFGQLLALCIVIFQHSYVELEYVDNLSLTNIAFILLTITSVIFLFFVSDIERKHQLELDLKELEYAYKSEADYYREFENKNYEISKIRHDIKNHIITIKGLYENGNKNEIVAMLNDLENSIDSSKLKEYCKIPVVNAILSEKVKICELQKISIDIQISISDIGTISPVHISSIFSNLMDNAIKSANAINRQDKYIRLNAIQQSEYIIISTVNSTADTKSRILIPEESKGYGLKILKDISQKYDGAFKAEVKNGVCETQIMVRTTIEFKEGTYE